MQPPTGVGKFCNHCCKVLFERHSVIIFAKDNSILLTGWHKEGRARLWRFSLCPEDHPSIPTEWTAVSSALNAHNLPSVGAPIYYTHAVTGFPVKSTWPAAVKADN